MKTIANNVFQNFKALNTYMLSKEERKSLKKIDDWSIVYKFFETVYYSNTRPTYDKIAFFSIYGLSIGAIFYLFGLFFANIVYPVMTTIVWYTGTALLVLQALLGC